MQPPALGPKTIADGIESLSSSLIICLATFSGVMFSSADGGAVVLEKPGWSKVVMLKVSDRRLITLENGKQSPSPEGMKSKCGPEPLCSTCQEIPSSVST